MVELRAMVWPALALGVLAAARGGLAPSPTADVAEVAALVRTLNAGQFGGWFREADVLAVIAVESSFRPAAVNENDGGSPSYGLMQLKLDTARDRGYGGAPAGLLDPAINVLFGMRQLRWVWDAWSAAEGRPPTLSQWLTGYNAGFGRARSGYIAHGYVQRWAAAREAF